MLKRLMVTDDLEAWITELRSGKWKQIKSQPRDDGLGRCAWGVAEEVVGRGTDRMQRLADLATEAQLDIVWLNDVDDYGFTSIAQVIEDCLLQPVREGTGPGIAHLYPCADEDQEVK